MRIAGDFTLASAAPLHAMLQEGIIDKNVKFTPVLDGFRMPEYIDWELQPFTHHKVLLAGLSSCMGCVDWRRRLAPTVHVSSCCYARFACTLSPCKQQSPMYILLFPIVLATVSFSKTTPQRILSLSLCVQQRHRNVPRLCSTWHCFVWDIILIS